MSDKVKHILAGVAIAAFCGIPVYTNSYDLFGGIWSALCGGLTAAGVKEWCDMHTDGNKWDWMDFGFTCLGAVIVAVFIVCLHFGKG